MTLARRLVLDDLESYCVVKEQYTPHAEMLKQSVTHWNHDGYNCVLMTNQTAVKQALREEAIQLTNTRIENPF